MLEQIENESTLHRKLELRHSQSRIRCSRSADRPAVQRAREYLLEHLSEKVALQKVASIAGYSPTHFLRIFRQEVGLTPHAFHLQARIERASTLISRGQPISYVAFDCGFSDQSHLGRRFKKIMGVTPGEFSRSRLAAQLAA